MIRNVRTIVVTAVAISCFAASETLVAQTLPNVVYTASGVFSGVVSGTDPFELNNQPFTMSIYANEGKIPAKSGQQNGTIFAQYTNCPMQGSITSGLGVVVPLKNKTTGIVLAIGSTADSFTLGTGVVLSGNIQVGISAKVIAPKGTITSLRIQPFTAPVTLTASNATATYTFQGTSTTLGLSGTLTGTVVAAASTQLFHAGAQVISSHSDGTQSVRALGAAPVAPSADKVSLSFYASGVRGASDVHVQISGQEVPVLYAGAAGNLGELDQVVVEVPRSLAGLGKADVVLTADGQTASPVHIQIQ